MNDSLVTEVVISSEYHGQRVDVVLAQLFPDFSRSQLSHWLKEGAITLNQRTCKPKEKVLGGEILHLNILLTANHATQAPSVAEDIPIDVVYEDDHLLVINKPSGLVVHPGAGNQQHTLVNALLHHDASLQHLPRAGIVHRLDKETTGLLIVARTITAYTSLIRQMQARDIQRSYIALVHGDVIAGSTIDTCYGRHPRNRLKMSVCSHGKQAITQFSLRKQYQYVTLLDVKLMTGRTHQIRVHMDHVNHPVVGDPLYGGRSRIPAGLSEASRLALKQFTRQALHASSLSFLHPHTQEELNLKAPLPDDFQTLLTILDAEFA